MIELWEVRTIIADRMKEHVNNMNNLAIEQREELHELNHRINELAELSKLLDR